MAEIIPEGRSGNVRIEHTTVTADQVKAYAEHGETLEEGRIAQLIEGKTVWMSDAKSEHMTNVEVVEKAWGRVLIAGLGLGMILTKILEKPEVQSVLVLERSQDVIDLISPHFRDYRLSVWHVDVRKIQFGQGRSFDTIYFDIWADQPEGTLADMNALMERFRPYLAYGGWMDCWNRKNVERREVAAL